MCQRGAKFDQFGLIIISKASFLGFEKPNLASPSSHTYFYTT